jgi:hypothetical protein
MRPVLREGTQRSTQSFKRERAGKWPLFARVFRFRKTGFFRIFFVRQTLRDPGTAAADRCLTPHTLAELGAPALYTVPIVRRNATSSTAIFPLILALAPGASGQTRVPDRKGVVIGINCYDPNDQARPTCGKLRDMKADRSVERPGVTTGDSTYWKYRNLRGAVRDAETMTAILRSQGFAIPKDAYLVDADATAAAILRALRKYLIDDTVNAQPGDVRFVYYSGHGNYVRNLAVKDPNSVDRYDETIVPSDHWLGTPDIRDKELSRIFTEASKRVRIVFVADSCHSGSLARGPEGMVKTAISGSADDPAAPKVIDAAPPDHSRQNGLILLSAARRDQPALETEAGADAGDEAGPHGAFTWALRQALVGEMEAPVRRVFDRAASILATDKPNQVPNLDGLRTSDLNLFGVAARDYGVQTLFVEEVKGDEVHLRGGRAIGIYKGTELKSVAKDRPSVMLRVAQEQGIDASIAEVIEHGPGGYHVRTGDRFQVNKWVITPEAMLKIAIPPSMPGGALRAVTTEFAKLPAQLGERWVEDETESTPNHYLRWSGSTWILEKGDVEEGGTDLGEAPAAAAILEKLPADAKLFVSLPPPLELSTEFPFGKPEDSRIVVTRTGTANYRLRGRLHNEQAEYAWVRPAVAVAKALNSNVMSLPLRTDWIPAESRSPAETAEVLADKVHHLGKLKEWQTLPSVGSSSPFPYRLEVHDAKTGRVVNQAAGGQQLKLFLKADAAALKKAGPITPRYTYIFAIDQFGKSTLLWPVSGQGTQDNVFPPLAPSGEKRPAAPLEIAVSGTADYDVQVDEPYGNDAYMLLTSVQPLSNPEVLDGTGVRTRGAGSNPLEDLLADLGAMTRGAAPKVPTDWNLETTIIRSVPPAK